MDSSGGNDVTKLKSEKITQSGRKTAFSMSFLGRKS